MSGIGTLEMTSAGERDDRRDGRGGEDGAGGSARWLQPLHFAQHLIRPHCLFAHLMDRQHGDFDVCCSPGTSATQHFSLNDLAFSASIWLFGCCSLVAVSFDLKRQDLDLSVQ